MRKLLVLLCFTVFFSACASGPTKNVVSKEGEIARQWIEESVTEDAIITIGIGAADQTMENKTQKMATSRNAAIIDAQYKMLSIVKGSTINGDESTEKTMLANSKIRAQIDALIKGATIIKTDWTDDDGCVVTLRLLKSELKKLGIKI